VQEVTKGKTEWTEVRKGRWERKIDRETPTGHKNPIGRIVINEIMGKFYATPSTTKFTQVFDTLEQAKSHYDNIDGLSGNTKYSEYVLPGGKNYKELLLTMPQKQPEREYYIYDVNTDEVIKTSNDKYKLREELKRLNNKDYFIGENHKNQNPTFQSSHYDEPNILAHVRFDERNVNGEKVLFIEEFQSDFSQSLRKKEDEFRRLLKENPEKVIDMFKKSGKLEVLCP
jgi:hypothetical protein